jgi:hypothetical protein
LEYKKNNVKRENDGRRRIADSRRNDDGCLPVKVTQYTLGVLHEPWVNVDYGAGGIYVGAADCFAICICADLPSTVLFDPARVLHKSRLRSRQNTPDSVSSRPSPDVEQPWFHSRPLGV